MGTTVRAPAPPSPPPTVPGPARAAGATRVAARLTGTIAPAPAGTRLEVQRRAGGRWRTVADAVVRAGGRYEAAVARPGLYRVAFRGALGPTTRVG